MNEERQQLQQTINSLHNQLGDLNARLETKPTRSNSLHEIEEAFEEEKNDKTESKMEEIK